MRRHLIIPDCQVKPGVPLDHLEWCGKYIAEKKPDVVVQLGDFADMESLSLYDIGKRSFEGKRYKKDLEAIHRGLCLLQKGMGNFRAKRRVLTLGNHEDRINRVIESDPKLEGTISLADLGYEKFGWEVIPYLKPICIDGVTYAHYFPTGLLGRPATTAQKILSTYHVSCVAGHQQGRNSAGPISTGHGKTIQAIIAGSFYLHNENYLTPLANNHWRGIIVLNEVHQGQFDEMFVSLGFLRRKYGPKPRTRRSGNGR